MEIRAEEITRILREQIEGFTATIDVAEIGTVISVGDGIARIHGLERCMAGELIEFPHGVSGIALNLEEDQVGAVLLGEYQPRSRKATRCGAPAASCRFPWARRWSAAW